MLAPRKWLLFALGAGCLFAVLAGLPGCKQETDPWGGTTKLRVVASFPPIYCFVQNVAGSEVAARSLLDVQGPHGYQYNSRDVRLLRKADVFLVNGLNLDNHFTDRIVSSCGNDKLTHVRVGECIGASRREKMKEGGGHVCPHHPPGSEDPHVWLGIPEAIDMVKCITDTLKQKDPSHAADYERRSNEYIDRLKKVHAAGREKLAGKKIKIISVHESLAYFARSFDVEIAGSIQMAPGDEPSGSRLRELTKLCVENGVHIIAVEPQYPDATAQTLLNALKAKGVSDAVVVKIDTLETVPEGVEGKGYDAGWYERTMTENIDNLARAVP